MYDNSFLTYFLNKRKFFEYNGRRVAIFNEIMENAKWRDVIAMRQAYFSRIARNSPIPRPKKKFRLKILPQFSTQRGNMNKTPVYVSFDFDNDAILKQFVIGQSKNPDSPFSVIDHSIKEEVRGNWVADAERRIKKAEIVLVIVGKYTCKAQGVLKEVALARKHQKKVVQVIGYRDSNPKPVPNAGRLYRWNWENLRTIFHQGGIIVSQ